MTATADIIVKKVDNAILIPNAALRFAPPTQQAQNRAAQQWKSVQPPVPRRRHDTQKPREAVNGDNTQGRGSETLQQTNSLPSKITTGATNGVMTQITGGGIESGTPLVVDMTGSGG